MSVRRWALVAGGVLAVVVVSKRRRKRKQVEVSSGSRPIEGVGTAVAGFVGPQPETNP
jgi:hypothetical protein